MDYEVNENGVGIIGTVRIHVIPAALFDRLHNLVCEPPLEMTVWCKKKIPRNSKERQEQDFYFLNAHELGFDFEDWLTYDTWEEEWKEYAEGAVLTTLSSLFAAARSKRWELAGFTPEQREAFLARITMLPAETCIRCKKDDLPLNQDTHLCVRCLVDLEQEAKGNKL